MVINMAKKTKSGKKGRDKKETVVVEEEIVAKEVVKVEEPVVEGTAPLCTSCDTPLTLLKYSSYGEEFECKNCKKQYAGRPN